MTNTIGHSSVSPAGGYRWPMIDIFTPAKSLNGDVILADGFG
ncbi:MAG: hypothetical protein ABI650_01610 [Dokdonella sp.]